MSADLVAIGVIWLMGAAVMVSPNIDRGIPVPRWDWAIAAVWPVVMLGLVVALVACGPRRAR